MLFGLIDRTTNAAALKTALDQSVQRSRVIGDRVARASVNNGDGFVLKAKEATPIGMDATEAADAAADKAYDAETAAMYADDEAATDNGEVNDINVEDEMAALGDEQLRFLATSRLLEKTYASLRSAIKGER